MCKKLLILVGILAATTLFKGYGVVKANILAFPTAEGYGAKSLGGGGGKIIEVTNLEDKGPGSLREALQKRGPRIIAFKVSGIILLKDDLVIREPFVTIDGQTAPAEGICLKNAGLRIMTHDVIIRYLHIRPGDSRVGSKPENRDAIKINGYNVMLDHISASWAIDEVISVWDSHDITIQWSMISEALFKSLHPKGGHSMGLLIRNNVKNISIHHNLFAHNNARNPRLGGDVSVDFVNNVIYNWGIYGTGVSAEGRTKSKGKIMLGPVQANILNNYYKEGPNSKGEPLWFGKLPTGSKIFIDGNRINPRFSSRYRDYSFIISQSFPIRNITVHSVEKAYNLILENAGANLPVQDRTDSRIIKETRNGTGKIIDFPPSETF